MEHKVVEREVYTSRWCERGWEGWARVTFDLFIRYKYRFSSKKRIHMKMVEDVYNKGK